MLLPSIFLIFLLVNHGTYIIDIELLTCIFLIALLVIIINTLYLWLLYVYIPYVGIW